LQNFYLQNFQENYNSKNNSANRARLILLQRIMSDQTNIHDPIKFSRNKENIVGVTPEIYEENIAEILNWKKETFRDYIFSKKALFVPARAGSIFSDNEYLYDIKYSKFLSRSIKNKVKLNGYESEENIAIFKELYSLEHSLKYNCYVSYFDPIKYIIQDNDDLMNEVLHKLKFDTDDQINFINDFLEIINYQYHRAIITQQEYVLKTIILSISKSRRRMSLKDVLLNILQRFEKDEEGGYFLCEYIQRDYIIFILNLIEDVDSMDYRALYAALNLLSQDLNRDDYINIYALIMMLENLFDKKSLLSISDETLKDIENVFEHYNIAYTRKIKLYLSNFLKKLFDVSVEKGNRKYVNSLYMEDIDFILKQENKLFTTIFAEYFDFLLIYKLHGMIDEQEESSFFKKTLYNPITH
jgi:hypothetical protein